MAFLFTAPSKAKFDVEFHTGETPQANAVCGIIRNRIADHITEVCDFDTFVDYLASTDFDPLAVFTSEEIERIATDHAQGVRDLYASYLAIFCAHDYNDITVQDKLIRLIEWVAVFMHFYFFVETYENRDNCHEITIDDVKTTVYNVHIS